MAILRDAAAQLGRIEGQMAGSRSDARAMLHQLAAVDVLENTIRLLGAQRTALLEQAAVAAADPPSVDVPRSSERPRAQARAASGT